MILLLQSTYMCLMTWWWVGNYLNVHSSAGTHTIHDDQLPAVDAVSNVLVNTPKIDRNASIVAGVLGLQCPENQHNQMEQAK